MIVLDDDTVPGFIPFDPVCTHKQRTVLKKDDAVDLLMLIDRKIQNTEPHLLCKPDCVPCFGVCERLRKIIVPPDVLCDLVHFSVRVIRHQKWTELDHICIMAVLEACQLLSRQIELVGELTPADHIARPMDCIPVGPQC